MGTFNRFEDIEAWQEARKMVKAIYDLTRLKSFQKDYALIDQLRRAAISVPSNIAEGFGRGSDREFGYYLSIAGASAREVQSLCYIALDQEYMQMDQFDTLYTQIDAISDRIGALMKYLRESDLKGNRYK